MAAVGGRVPIEELATHLGGDRMRLHPSGGAGGGEKSLEREIAGSQGGGAGGAGGGVDRIGGAEWLEGSVVVAWCDAADGGGRGKQRLKKCGGQSW